MPIKPEKRSLYPKDWPRISLEARERARWRCQHPGCTARQYSVGHWIIFGGGDAHEWRPVVGNTPSRTHGDRAFHMAGEGRDIRGEPWTYGKARAFVARWWDPHEEGRPTIIVLTVAHLNHDPTDCRPENLAAMCQRHHLAYDAALHAANAYETRRSRKAIGDLFA